MNVESSNVNLEPLTLVHDDVELIGEIAIPAGTGPHPAVMVMHNALGMDDFIRDRVRRLARLGYVAIATDMYGQGRDGFRDDPQAGGSLMMALVNKPEHLRARVVAWYEKLKSHPQVDAARIAAIGFCFGGQCVLELARSGVDAKAIVSYHGLLTTALPAQPGAVQAHVTVYTGAKDPYVPAADVAALRHELNEAGAHFQITEFSDAYHAFTDPRSAGLGRPGIGYDKIADAVSWAGTLALFETLV